MPTLASVAKKAGSDSSRMRIAAINDCSRAGVPPSVTNNFRSIKRCRRVPRLLIVESASFPLGTTTMLSAKVRTRVERMPTCSTEPSTPSVSIQSPLRNGRSVTRMPAPKTFESVSRDAKANARPPIPSPASMLVAEIENTVAIPSRPPNTMPSRSTAMVNVSMMSSVRADVRAARAAKISPSRESTLHATNMPEMHTTLPKIGIVYCLAFAGIPSSSGIGLMTATTNNTVSARGNQRGCG